MNPKTKSIRLHGISLPCEAHTLITGRPGTGKTRAILRPLLRAYLSRNADSPEEKVGLLLLDPKGDMLGWVADLLHSLNRAEDLVVVGEGHRGFNLFAQMPLPPMQYALRIYQLGNALDRSSSLREDNEYWRHQQQQILEVLIEVARLVHPDRCIQVKDLCHLRFHLLPKLRTSFGNMTGKFHLDQLSPESLGILKDFSNLPNDTRECVLSTVGNCLAVFRQPPLAQLMNPAADNGIDLVKIISEGKCVVVSCATRSFADSSLPLLVALKEAFADLVLSRSEIEVSRGKESWEPLNQTREVLYVADECHRILRQGNAGGELDFLDLCREFKCRALLATQSLSALQSVMGTKAADRLVALCGNHFYLNNIDPSTGEWADRMFRSSEAQSPPPMLVPARRGCDTDWAGPLTLATLKTGEFLVRTRNGTTYRKNGSRYLGKG